ncbi:two component transcriptional regulator, Fis family [Pelodictyon luteolum DSM 273]|uniref:Two component transcriptional regulator, Fis family n=1 Tax=Chlorobium luteolum (strain DSM 273 / BCRC 81028 / 2530) TaxID=319225 RepID=Q3B305_CHLL3|nr:two component transcriptional regulator, Fis family [Pelodictyon luteolum DSM 273]
MKRNTAVKKTCHTIPPSDRKPAARKNTVLIADDDETSRRIFSHFVRKMGYTALVVQNGMECIESITEQSPDVILLDINMPGKDGFEVMLHMKTEHIKTPVIIITASHDIPQAVKCIKLGAYEYLTKPLNIDRLEIVMRNSLAESALQIEVKNLKKELRTRDIFQHIIGRSRAIKASMEQAVQVMETDLNVLILGESGTGKELFAQAIHQGSRRNCGPFVSVNCAAISSTLADSILFGHAKGSFTGAATDHTGFFEQADKGTIFLDEIGDMEADIQAKVLRAIQERKIRRVGEKHERSVDFRVISATNRNFADAIRSNQFREDLYYRLEEFPLFLPPLRERPEDIPLLARHFLDEFASANNIEKLSFTDEALAGSKEYHWPGNIRELKNAVQRAAVTRKGDEVDSLRPILKHGNGSTAGHPASALAGSAAQRSAGHGPDMQSYSLEEHEREAILKAYKASNGNLTKTARMLGIGRATLYRKLDKFGLEYLKTG